MPEPLRMVEPLESVTKRMHAEMDYSAVWLALYENIVRVGEIVKPKVNAIKESS